MHLITCCPDRHFLPQKQTDEGCKGGDMQMGLGPLFLDNNGTLSTAKGVIFILQLFDLPFCCCLCKQPDFLLCGEPHIHIKSST